MSEGCQAKMSQFSRRNSRSAASASGFSCAPIEAVLLGSVGWTWNLTISSAGLKDVDLDLLSVGERSNFKFFLRTRKIMVMHSNDRGECRLRTLIDRKRKRYNNAVDVVVRLHDRPILSTERTAPPCSAHVQLDDVPRTVDPVEAEGEFRQHDGVVTVMMKLPA